MADDEYDGETIDDIDPDEVGFDAGTRQVTVQDGNDVVVYVEGDDCHRCPRDAVGVVVAPTGNGDVVHHAVCEPHLTEYQEKDDTMNFEFRAYE